MASSFAATIDLSSLDGTNGFRLDGFVAGDSSVSGGGGVSGAGDVNGDGFADVIIGAPDADGDYSAAGSSYVVFGRAPDSARIRVGSAAAQYISGGQFSDTLKGKVGADTLEGRGGADALFGGPVGDAASYLHAPRSVKANIAAPGDNTGHAAGDSYFSIQNLAGSRFADELTGDSHANRLIGSAGRDLLTGGGGDDLFVLNATSDSRPGLGRDRISDFDAGDAATSVDKIVLRAIDAKTGRLGNQALTFIGAAPFTNIKGQLRVRHAGTSAIVAGDVNGDETADFEIELLSFTDLSTLTAIDFRL